MARSINQVILLGRLTRDPEQRTTASGKNVVSFSIAVDRQSQDDQADFFNITAWDKLGDLVMQYLSKGRRVLIQGRLRQDSWEDKDTGKRQSRIEVTASDVTLQSFYIFIIKNNRWIFLQLCHFNLLIRMESRLGQLAYRQFPLRLPLF